MSGRMPVYRDSKFMGVILWAGTMASGKWSFRANAKLPKDETAEVREQLKFLERSQTDLKWMRYRGIKDRTYPGWSGFPGTLGAFEAALPAVGLRIDRSDTNWPPYKLKDQPDGIDTESAEEQYELYQQIDAVESEADLVAFRERQQGSI